MIKLIPRKAALLATAAMFCTISCKKLASDIVPVKTVSTKDSVIKTIATSTVLTPLKTRNVIVIVVDGARYSETWGDSTHQYIPNLYKLSNEGVVLTNFKNNGVTYTDPGHTAISTGNYENIENSGKELPSYPSMLQLFLKKTGQPANRAWIITSKEKLNILANCNQYDWKDKYQPLTDCGPGYRSDDTTYTHAANVLKKYHPNLLLINFKDPDINGHINNWTGYLKGIQTTDAQIKGLYDLIQSDPIYKDQTAIIVTNDHGRHLNGIADGFISHGCNCEGCRHIEFFAIGPDFKKGAVINEPYEQLDISKTVAKLLNFDMPYSKGKVMTQLFK